MVARLRHIIHIEATCGLGPNRSIEQYDSDPTEIAAARREHDGAALSVNPMRSICALAKARKKVENRKDENLPRTTA